MIFSIGLSIPITWLTSGVTKSDHNVRSFSQEVSLCVKESISYFKGFNVLATCICILAVDFPVFPRSLAKTECFGISLMDIGVGLYVFSSAITSKYSRRILPAIISIDIIGGSQGTPTSGKRICLSYQRLAVLMFGIGRMVLIEAVGYQVHVSEYGTHWNFFVTLFFIWTIADGVHAVFKSDQSIWILTICMLGGYQWLLLNEEWLTYLFSNNRQNFFHGNKEGIVSLLGYIPMYLITELLAKRFLHSLSLVSSSYELLRKILQLVLVVAGGWIGWGITSNYVQPTSRRLANPAFVFLVLAASFSILLSIGFVLILFKPTLLTTTNNTVHPKDEQGSNHFEESSHEISSLLHFNRHGLVTFLIANLTTGFINMTVQTIHTNNETALTILVAYTFFISCVPWMAEGLTKYINDSKKQTNERLAVKS